MCAFRNNGIYAFYICVPFFIWQGRKYWKRMTIISLICIGLYIGYSGPFSKILGVVPGSVAEALSVPMQQLSRAINYNKDELTDWEKGQIEYYIPGYVNYISRTADPVKSSFSVENFEGNVGGFVKLWLNVGIKCPLTYIDSFLTNSIGFWYPDMQYPDTAAWHPYLEYENIPYDFHIGKEYEAADNWLLIERSSKSPNLDRVLHKWAYEATHQKYPVISAIFNPGVYVWMMIFILLLVISKRKWNQLPAMMLITGFWMTLLLSPVVLVRYAYPIMVAMPILLKICMDCFTKETKITAEKEL